MPETLSIKLLASITDSSHAKPARATSCPDVDCGVCLCGLLMPHSSQSLHGGPVSSLLFPDMEMSQECGYGGTVVRAGKYVLANLMANPAFARCVTLSQLWLNVPSKQPTETA